MDNYKDKYLKYKKKYLLLKALEQKGGMNYITGFFDNIYNLFYSYLDSNEQKTLNELKIELEKIKNTTCWYKCNPNSEICDSTNGIYKERVVYWTPNKPGNEYHKNTDRYTNYTKKLNALYNSIRERYRGNPNEEKITEYTDKLIRDYALTNVFTKFYNNSDAQNYTC